MAEIEIRREEQSASKGRYVVWLDGAETEAEITYSRMGESAIIAEHTGVPDSYRGQGLAGKLVAFMIDDLRARGIALVPLCPYVKGQIERHPEYADVVKG